MKRAFNNSNHRLEAVLQSLLREPDPDQPYHFSGCTTRDVYGMARNLAACLDGRSATDRYVCLGTQDRAVLAAAILAVLSNPYRKLLLPYSESAGVLQELHQQAAYRLAISDHPERFPNETTVIHPARIPSADPALRLCREMPDPDRPFLYLFTGGSTGRPKIWPKTIRNLLGEALFLKDKFQIQSTDRIVATVPPYHIYGMLFSVLLPLVSGAPVMDRTPTFPQEIVQAVTDSRATILVSVPPNYRTISNQTISDSRLRLAFSSAGALDPRDGERFFRHNRLDITEIYGSTETGGIACRMRSTGGDTLMRFETVDVKIIDHRIHVRSDYISPNVSRDADGYFQTGDRGELRDPDRFVLTGRSDGIVKIGGKRVDLEEVQEKIEALPEVSEAKVIALPTQNGREKEIAALVQTHHSAAAVRDRLAPRLEPYARPRRLRVTNRIPKNKMGKYDMEAIRSLLQSPEQPAS